MKRILPNAETMKRILCVWSSVAVALKLEQQLTTNKACANTSKANTLAVEFTPTYPRDHCYSNLSEP